MIAMLVLLQVVQDWAVLRGVPPIVVYFLHCVPAAIYSPHFVIGVSLLCASVPNAHLGLRAFCRRPFTHVGNTLLAHVGDMLLASKVILELLWAIQHHAASRALPAAIIAVSNTGLGLELVESTLRAQAPALAFYADHPQLASVGRGTTSVTGGLISVSHHPF